MTIPLAHQIESAERNLFEEVRDGIDPGHSLREASANWIRSSAALGLELADRLDPCRPSHSRERYLHPAEGTSL